MSLEIKRINDLEFQPFLFADEDLVIELEMSVMTTKLEDIQVNCYKCHTRIPAGTGSYCQTCMVK